jgi:aspartoacylase
MIHTLIQQRLLDYVESFNQSPHQVQSENEFTIYKLTGTIDYPRDKNGEIQAMIHPLQQFQDYQPLDNNAPLFLTFDGTTIFYQGESIVYPVFINEAAYYEKGIAMCLTSQVRHYANSLS